MELLSCLRRTADGVLLNCATTPVPQGAWSDESELWQKHPQVKEECKPAMDADDGMFWMAWGDFLKYFGTVDVCSRTRTARGDLALDVHEEMGCGGPAYGCCVVRVLRSRPLPPHNVVFPPPLKSCAHSCCYAHMSNMDV